MSARAKITMSPEEYLAGLRKLEAETNKSASKMENSFKKYGTSINKAGIAMRYMSAEMGAGAFAFGRAFQVLAGGKIAVAVAAVAGAFTALKKILDELTVSSDEYKQKVDVQVESNNKNIESMRKTQGEEDSMLERLQELAKRENKTNEEKAEQIRLAEILTGKYGKLRISVGDLTGDYTSLLAVMKKINDAQNEERASALENQIKTIQSRISDAAKEGIVGGIFSQAWDFMKRSIGLSRRPVSSSEVFDYYNSMSAEDKLAYAQSMLNPSNELGAKTDSEISFWKSQQSELETLIDLTQKLNSLRSTGFETQKEELDNMKQSSEESGKTTDAEKDAADEKLKYLEKLAAEEAKIEKERLSAIEKERNAYADMLNEQEKKRKQLLSTQVNSLKFAAMRALGMDREADIEEALTGELGMSGVDPNTIIEMVDARRALEASMQKSTAPELYAPRVNSLIARGGSAAPVKMPEVEKLQTKQLDAQNKTILVAQQILNRVDAWTTY